MTDNPESAAPGRMSVLLSSADMKKSVAFYRDVLGFELKECWPDAGDPKWANLVLNGQSVMLGERMTPDAVEACTDDAEMMALHRSLAKEQAENRPGTGVFVYLEVGDLDGFAKEVQGRGARLDTHPKDQFYGIREFHLRDPDAYRLIFFKPITLSSCQSCGMPLAEAKPGQMYCSYCTDETGRLRSYEEVFEGTVSGFFMGMQKMPRAEAEKAAREHLAKMPAWQGRG